MAGDNFSISGLSALQGRLSSVGIGKASEKNMAAAASHLEGEIRERAPVDTGHLRGSYGHIVQGGDKGAVAHVGTNVEYAAAQEYGTVHQGGTPHVRPALDANRDQLVKMMAADTLKEALGL